MKVFNFNCNNRLFFFKKGIGNTFSRRALGLISPMFSSNVPQVFKSGAHFWSWFCAVTRLQSVTYSRLNFKGGSFRWKCKYLKKKGGIHLMSGEETAQVR